MTRGKAIPPSEGLVLGYMAAMEAAAKQQNPIGSEYAEMLRKNIVSDTLPNSSHMEGTLVELPAIEGVSQDPLPLATYERYNMSIDPKMFISNTRPINQDEYSIVNYALAPLPASPVSANPTTVEQFKGGAISTSGRGQQFIAQRIPTEIKNTNYDPATVLDQVTSVKQMISTTESMKHAKKKYAQGLKSFGARYGLDPASVFGGESTHVAESADGKEIPVVSSSGKHMGQARVPRDEAETHPGDFGYAVEKQPDQSLVPLVRVADYDGLKSYVDAYMSGQAKEKKEEEKHPRRKMRRDLNPIDYYLDAWTCSDRTPLQTALIIVTILLGLALVALLIWALVALARPRLRPNSHASHLDVEGTMGAPRPLVERALARSYAPLFARRKPNVMEASWMQRNE